MFKCFMVLYFLKKKNFKLYLMPSAKVVMIKIPKLNFLLHIVKKKKLHFYIKTLKNLTSETSTNYYSEESI